MAKIKKLVLSLDTPDSRLKLNLAELLNLEDHIDLASAQNKLKKGL